MWGVFRRFIVLLSVLAFVGGMTIQAIPSAEALGLTKANAVAKVDPDCPRMAMEHPDRGAPKPHPCTGIMPDCVKQMGCLGSPTSPGALRFDLRAGIIPHCPVLAALSGAVGGSTSSPISSLP